MYPATLYGRVVAATEIVCGIAFTAILTGLTFVRFSMVRIGNGRVGVLTDVAAKLNVFFFDTTVQGMPFRRAQELRLERTEIPVFTIFWTLMHVLDERSPLYGYDAARAIERDARVFLTPQPHHPPPSTLPPHKHDYNTSIL